MTAPHQGPREILRKRPVTLRQHALLAQALQRLEECQLDMHEVDGDSRERTKICKALESLYPLISRR